MRIQILSTESDDFIIDIEHNLVARIRVNTDKLLEDAMDDICDQVLSEITPVLRYKIKNELKKL